MEYKIYYECVGEAAYYTDRDTYINDLALSSIWGDDETADIPEDRIDELGMLWDAYHRSVKDIAAASGLSVRQLAHRFCIPNRTMEAWASNSASSRTATVYLLLMMQECLGLLPKIEI